MKKVIQIAKTCHNVNKAYCESIGDNSQPEWKDAPEWQKESAINGVNFHLSNPNSKPSDSHDNWLAEKEKDGWVYGEVKDPEKKTHPCMVPYENLPKEQQTKDALFIAVVRSFEEEEVYSGTLKKAFELEDCSEDTKVILNFINGDNYTGIFKGIDDDNIMLKAFETGDTIGLPYNLLKNYIELE